MQYSYGIDASSSSHLVCKKKRLLQRLKKGGTISRGPNPPPTYFSRYILVQSAVFRYHRTTSHPQNLGGFFYYTIKNDKSVI